MDEDPRSEKYSLEDWADLNELIEEKKKNWISPEPYMDLYPSVDFHGYKARKVGNKLYKRPPLEKEAFSNFIVALLIHDTLGEDWMQKQDNFPVERRHVVRKWLSAFDEWILGDVENSRMYETTSKKVSGAALSLLQLAYNCYCLQQLNKLPERMIARLRNYREFQGVEYEIAVAAIFVRAGFDIEFLEEQPGKKICEFVARHSAGLQIAVEAKSRHRSGVLNERGEASAEIKGDIKKLYFQAREKVPGMPFVIFIEPNIPTLGEIPSDKPTWIEDIVKIIRKATPENPSLHNLVVITNFGFHYSGNDQPSVFPFLWLQSTYTRYPNTHPELWAKLGEILERYSNLPRDI